MGTHSKLTDSTGLSLQRALQMVLLRIGSRPLHPHISTHRCSSPRADSILSKATPFT